MSKIKGFSAISGCLLLSFGLAHASPLTSPLAATCSTPSNAIFDSMCDSQDYLSTVTYQPDYITSTSSFTTPNSGFSFILTDVELMLADNANGNAPPANYTGVFTVALYSDSVDTTSAGMFGSPLATELDTSLSTTPTPYDFTADILLQPDTRYWIGVTPSDPNDTYLGWEFTYNPAGLEVATEYFGNAAYGDYPAEGYANGDPNYFTSLMEVGGYVAPEPSTVFLGLTGLAMLVVFRRRIAA
jgi:hypothetical protein